MAPQILPRVTHQQACLPGDAVILAKVAACTAEGALRPIEFNRVDWPGSTITKLQVIPHAFEFGAGPARRIVALQQPTRLRSMVGKTVLRRPITGLPSHGNHLGSQSKFTRPPHPDAPVDPRWQPGRGGPRGPELGLWRGLGLRASRTIRPGRWTGETSSP